MSACVAASQWTLALCIFCELCGCNLQPSLNLGLKLWSFFSETVEQKFAKQKWFGVWFSPTTPTFSTFSDIFPPFFLLFDVWRSVAVRISYNTASSAFEKNGKWQSALALLEESVPNDGIKVRYSFRIISIGGGNSNICYFHPGSLGKWSNLTNIFQMGWNHQLDDDAVGLEETRQSLRADVISYNTVISACEKAAAWEEALIMLCEIVRRLAGKIHGNHVNIFNTSRHH